MNCNLVIRESHKDIGRLGLYCADHDHYFKWLSDDECRFLNDNGIQTVKYCDSFAFYDPCRLYLRKTKLLVKVKNYRTDKKVEIYEFFQGVGDRDPSLKSYWDNIDLYKRKI